MKKTILVTGGAGFIGSNLCRFLLETTVSKVICLDNFFTGKKKNLSSIIDNPDFHIIAHDITETKNSIDSKISFGIDEIYHLACPASPIHYQFDPIETIKANTLGVINILEFARLNGAKILQTSTSEIYGDPMEHPQKETYRGNVNTLGPRACYSEDTEVLTKDGFKFFKDLTKADEILTIDSSRKIQYHKPIEIIKQEYHGELIEFKSPKIDLQVTPNHSMYVKPRDDLKKKQFMLIKAFESINWKRAEMLKSANWGGDEENFFYLPKVKNNKFGDISKIIMDDWLEFFGYYITEGCVHLRKRLKKIKTKWYNTIDYNILIAQDRKNKENWDKIRSCLSRLPFKFFDSDDHQFRICNKQLALYLKQFGKAKNKFIPTNLKNLSKRQLRILFEALMFGDGSKDKRAFYTSSIILAGDFQEICLKLGMASNIHKIDKRKSNAVYHLQILTDIKKDFLTPKYPERKTISYNGFVYCVNVKNHVIYVRRNGKSLFCGNCYDEGKRVAETLFMDYHRKFNLPIRIARIFNTYGPNMDKNDGRVVSNFIVQALSNEPITIYGDGNQTRSFCYVHDQVTGLYSLMQSDEIGPINLGNPGEFTIKELAEKVIKLTGSSSKIVYNSLPEDDPKKRKPDISLAKEKLDWSPKVNLEKGLIKTIDYFKNNL